MALYEIEYRGPNNHSGLPSTYTLSADTPEQAKSVFIEREGMWMKIEGVRDLSIPTTWAEFQKIHGLWSDATFGTRAPAGPLHHLLKEVQETIEAPHDITEYADCMMLLLDALRIAGITTDDLFTAVMEKFQINKARTWGKPDQNGTVEHVRK